MGTRRPADACPQSQLLDQGQPYLDRIIIKIIPEASARLLALQAGEVDYIDQYYFPLSAYDMLAKDPQLLAEGSELSRASTSSSSTRASRRSTKPRCARRC